jgi:hypothetical protein
MIIKPGDVHDNPEKARLGVGLAAEAFGIECNLKLQTMWMVKVDGNDLKSFLEFAREFANNPEGK